MRCEYNFAQHEIDQWAYRIKCTMLRRYFHKWAKEKVTNQLPHIFLSFPHAFFGFAHFNSSFLSSHFLNFLLCRAFLSLSLISIQCQLFPTCTVYFYFLFYSSVAVRCVCVHDFSLKGILFKIRLRVVFCCWCRKHFSFYPNQNDAVVHVNVDDITTMCATTINLIEWLT